MADAQLKGNIYLWVVQSIISQRKTNSPHRPNFLNVLVFFLFFFLFFAGSALLVLTATDTSAESYYGDQGLHYVGTDGESCLVPRGINILSL